MKGKSLNGKEEIKVRLYDIFADYLKDGNIGCLIKLGEEFSSLYESIGKKAVDSLLSMIEEIYSHSKHSALELALESKRVTELLEKELKRRHITNLYAKIEKIPSYQLKIMLFRTSPWLIHLNGYKWWNSLYKKLYKKVYRKVQKSEEEAIEEFKKEYNRVVKGIH